MTLESSASGICCSLLLGVLPLLTCCCVSSLGSPEWKRLRAIEATEAEAADGEATEKNRAEREGAKGETNKQPDEDAEGETDKQPVKNGQTCICVGHAHVRYLSLALYTTRLTPQGVPSSYTIILDPIDNTCGAVQALECAGRRQRTEGSMRHKSCIMIDKKEFEDD